MMDTAAFALDERGDAAFVSGYGIILKPDFKELMAYFTGILNSDLVSGILKSLSTALRGGWYRTFPQFLRQLPIKLPETAEEKKLAERITQSVRAIMEAKATLRALRSFRPRDETNSKPPSRRTRTASMRPSSPSTA